MASRDVVIGIAASGRTPFVWGALAEAKKRRAKTILLTFNPKLQLPNTPKLDLLLAIDVGPELLTGSTRLKSGTATKLVLNILTTLTMVRLGKVSSNLMIDLNPSNIKLRDRAIRIVQQITNTPRETAETALQKSNWIVKDALQNLR
jgi:N-acetylmuramic acid 6-phosphate etherase